MSKRQKVMVIGSGGFIGSNFIRQSIYNRKPYIISSIDKVREDHIIHNIYINQDHSFHIADICDSHILHVIFEKERPDVIIFSADDRSETESTIKTNLLGLNNVINECSLYGSRIIYLSDYGVLGTLTTNELPQDENSPKAQIDTDPFLIIKSTAEDLLKCRSNNYIIARLDSNYGPWQTCNETIPKIIRGQILDQEEYVEPAMNVKSYTHVYDTCSAISILIENGQNKETYNISNNQEFSTLEIANIISNSFVKNIEKVKFTDLIQPQRQSLIGTKLKSIGWKPEYKLRDGINQTCQWYVSNKYVFNL
jgi:dTDP-glucose 4,6-dehydratase